jgi:hypothetical protein
MNVVAVDTINTIRTPLTTIDVEIIDTILAIPDDVPIQTVLVAHTTEDEVAVLRHPREIRILTFVRLNIESGDAGHFFIELVVLLEEWFCEIKILTII